MSGLPVSLNKKDAKTALEAASNRLSVTNGFGTAVLVLVVVLLLTLVILKLVRSYVNNGTNVGIDVGSPKLVAA
jgi:hypothetical protein